MRKIAPDSTDLPAIIKHGLKGMNGHGEEHRRSRFATIKSSLTHRSANLFVPLGISTQARMGWRFVPPGGRIGGDRRSIFSSGPDARGDVQRARGGLMVPVSRKGNGSTAASATPVAVGKDVLDALLPA